jgi:hypothetical protein
MKPPCSATIESKVYTYVDQLNNTKSKWTFPLRSSNVLGTIDTVGLEQAISTPGLSRCFPSRLLDSSSKSFKHASTNTTIAHPHPPARPLAGPYPSMRSSHSFPAKLAYLFLQCIARTIVLLESLDFFPTLHMASDRFGSIRTGNPICQADSVYVRTAPMLARITLRGWEGPIC